MEENSVLRRGDKNLYPALFKISYYPSGEWEEVNTNFSHTLYAKDHEEARNRILTFQ